MGKPCNAATYREATRKLAAPAVGVSWEVPDCGAKMQADYLRELV